MRIPRSSSNTSIRGLVLRPVSQYSVKCHAGPTAGASSDQDFDTNEGVLGRRRTHLNKIYSGIDGVYTWKRWIRLTAKFPRSQRLRRPGGSGASVHT